MPTYDNSPALDQTGATTVLRPVGDDEGYWTGAPCVLQYDGRRLLGVRERTPDERGRAVHLYHHDEDLQRLTTVTADDLGVVSVERPSLVTDPKSGRLVAFLPVDHGSNQWTIRRLDAVDDPADLDPTTAREVLAPQAGATDSVTVKDPYVVTVGGRYHMFYAGHDGNSEQAHLATSVDGKHFERYGDNPVLGRQYWHDHHTRLSCVLPAPDAPAWWVFYEASATTDYGKTWNLRTALATSPDLRTVVDTSPQGPRYGSPVAGTATGVETFATLRYLDILEGPDGYEAYYEVAREDGAFELRHTDLIYE
ncbi:glycoside hydrolase family protein [Halorhabdus amylolytica]|uniref:hypothetical protein n=1 Tax=Halorhabdus amylolytica TaxID=2559573 RepID=UPI00145BC82E|nr:hypothetical protein [Halorhabdus amylolytica]